MLSNALVLILTWGAGLVKPLATFVFAVVVFFKGVPRIKAGTHTRGKHFQLDIDLSRIFGSF